MGKIKFLIEQHKKTGLPVFDFQYELINAVDHVNFLYPNDSDYEVELVKDVPDVIPEGYTLIPVGCVEFAREFFQKLHGFEPTPLNIPESICRPEFVKREIFLFNPTEPIPKVICKSENGLSRPVGSRASERFFIKSQNHIKEYSDVAALESLPMEDEWYFVSEIIPDIESEFRCFVYRDELIDIRQYSGDTVSYYHQPRLDIALVNRIIEAYKGNSPAYTLDMGTNIKRGSFIIELHNFWSCGLYGFSNYPKLLRMTVGGYHSELRRARDGKE